MYPLPQNYSKPQSKDEKNSSNKDKNDTAFLSEIIQARGKCNKDMYWKKKIKPKNSISSENTFKNGGKMKIFFQIYKSCKNSSHIEPHCQKHVRKSLRKKENKSDEKWIYTKK